MKQLPELKDLTKIIYSMTDELSLDQCTCMAMAITETADDVSCFDYTLTTERKQREREESKTASGRRYHLCRTVNYTLVPVIEAMPDSKMKNELINLLSLFLRMALIENDGAELSPSSLNRF